MKKTFQFLGLVLIILSVFACSFEIPKTVTVKGNPKLAFAADMDFSDVFSDMLSEGFGGGEDIEDMTILDAINSPPISGVEYKTLVVRMVLFEEKIKPPVGSTITIGGRPINISGTNISTGTSGIELFNENNIPLPIGEAFGDYLEGFTIDTTALKAVLYVNGNNVLSNMEMKMNIASMGEETVNTSTPKSSGISAGDKEFLATALPGGSLDVTSKIQSILSGSMTATSLAASAKLKPNETIMVSDLQNITLSAELVIWFPLIFKAGNNPVDGLGNGAKLKVEELNSAGEFLSEIAKSEMIERMDVALELTPDHPFSNGSLIIQDKNNRSFVIENPADRTTVTFGLSKSDIDYINDSGDSFDPELSLFFPSNEPLGITKRLGITGISIDAGINYDILEDEED
jgi:hypothetical protein